MIRDSFAPRVLTEKPNVYTFRLPRTYPNLRTLKIASQKWDFDQRPKRFPCVQVL